MAEVLNYSEEEVDACLQELKKKNILLGWRPVFNPSAEMDEVVRAVIEVKIKPERGGGFDELAERISRFDEVESCYLMSGGYDLQVVVKGKRLGQVAGFISERLATIEGVLSTASHFFITGLQRAGLLSTGPRRRF